MDMTVQETFDNFLLHLQNQEQTKPEDLTQTEQTFAQLTEYLIYYSDLFQAEELEEDMIPEDWEESLESFVNQLLVNDQENAPSLEELPLHKISGEYLRDFIAWHLLREPTVNSLIVQSSAETLVAWLQFCCQQSWLSQEKSQRDIDMLQVILPDAKRAAIAAHLLVYHVRLGGGISPRLRGKRFELFKEGHARVGNMDGSNLWLSFDAEPDTMIGPVVLPETIMQQLKIGDVIDVELGKRSDVWNIVDVGPVYPAVVYVEAEEMDLPDKLT
ncbi:MAG: hypothetical protein R8M45_05190 [Ghiorsea sp.]